MSPLMVFVAVAALLLAVVGFYERKVRALETNPVTRIKLVPRTMYEEQLGLTAATDSGGVTDGGSMAATVTMDAVEQRRLRYDPRDALL